MYVTGWLVKVSLFHGVPIFMCLLFHTIEPWVWIILGGINNGGSMYLLVKSTLRMLERIQYVETWNSNCLNKCQGLFTVLLSTIVTIYNKGDRTIILIKNNNASKKF